MGEAPGKKQEAAISVIAEPKYIGPLDTFFSKFVIAPLVFADDKAASLRKNTYDTIPRAQSLLSLRDSHQPMQVSGCQMASILRI